MRIRDRIRELRRVPANELLPNPRNWRTHPQQQADVLRRLLAEVGFADAMLARETPDGPMLIDLRCETARHLRRHYTGPNLRGPAPTRGSQTAANERAPCRGPVGRIKRVARVFALDLLTA